MNIAFLCTGEGSFLKFIYLNLSLLARVDKVFLFIACVCGVYNDLHNKIESKIFLNNSRLEKNDMEFEKSACQWLFDNEVHYVFLSCNKILKYELLKNYGEDNNRMFNCHPSLLPRLKGMNAVHRSFFDGEKYYGASIHRVTREVDGGEVLGSCVIAKRDQKFEEYKHRLFVNQAVLFLDFIYKISIEGIKINLDSSINGVKMNEGFYPKLSIDIQKVKYLNNGDEKYGLWNFVKQGVKI